MNVFCCGSNSSYQLGMVSTDKNVAITELVPSLSSYSHCLSKIVAAQNHTILVYETGCVLVIGDDRFFQIGGNRRIIYTKLTYFPLEGYKIRSAAAGNNYSIYLTSHGNVIMCTSQSIGNRIHTSLKNILTIHGGEKYCGAIDKDGSFCIFDKNDLTKTPQMQYLDESVEDMALCNDFVIVLTVDGVCHKSYGTFPYDFIFTPIASLRRSLITYLSGYSNHVIALSIDNEAYTYGMNNFGQLGTNSKISNFLNFSRVNFPGDEKREIKIVSIAASKEGSFFVTEDGKMYVCGNNINGQLFIPATKKPVSELTKVQRVSNIKQVFPGPQHTFLISGEELSNYYHSSDEENDNDSDDIGSLKFKLCEIENQNNNLQKTLKDFQGSIAFIKKSLESEKAENKILLEKLNDSRNQFSIQNNYVHDLESRIKVMTNKNNNTKSLDDLVINPNDYQIESNSTDIYEAVHKTTHTRYNCKVIPNQNDIQSFYSSNLIILNLIHPCITNIKGISFNEYNKSISVYLETKLGTLEDIIRQNPQWWTPTKRSICIQQIVLGMLYLHQNNIIYQDLNLKNICVTSRNNFKIANTFTTENSSSSKYLSPETKAQSKLSFFSDVFSFGLVLFAVITGNEVTTTESEIIKGNRDFIPDTVLPFAKDLIAKCWSHKPSDRGSFAEILDSLKSNHFMLFEDCDSGMLADYYDYMCSLEN